MATYGDWIEIFTILKKYVKPSPGAPHVTDPDKIYAFLDAQHEIIRFPFSPIYSEGGNNPIPEGSEDGKRLEELGCHICTETDCWAIFT